MQGAAKVPVGGVNKLHVVSFRMVTVRLNAIYIRLIALQGEESFQVQQEVEGSYL